MNQSADEVKSDSHSQGLAVASRSFANDDINHLHESFKRCEEKVRVNRDDVETLRQHVFSVLETIARNEKDERIKKKEHLETVRDAYTFITVDPWSLPAFSGWFIFAIQISSFFLSISSNLITSQSNFKNSPPLGFPVGVSTTVHASQGVALFLVVLVQDSMWEAVSDLFNGHNSHLQRQGISYCRWLIPNLMRLSVGFSALIATFILALASDNEVDLFKDFTAMLFISQLDNIVYFLASVDVLGSKMFQAVEKCEMITFKSTYQMSMRFNSSGRENPSENQSLWRSCFRFTQYILGQPQFFSLIVLIIAYVGWFCFVLKPHKDGKYLCQRISLQLDGAVNSDLPYFSGWYNIQTKGWSLHTEIRYKEDRFSRNDENAMILRYCHSIASWVFAYEDLGNPANECSDKLIFAKTTNVAEQQIFNIFEVSKDDWLVKSRDSRWMPFDELYIECGDNRQSYNFSNVCNNIAVDERHGPFVTTRSWATNFSIFNTVQAYERPVYRNDKDLIIFTGKSWVITDSTSFVNMTDTQELSDYLENYFHGRWSEYVVAFYSEPVITDTPQDTKTPIGLSWFEATPKIPRTTQERDNNAGVENVFLCTICNNDSNQCFYDGICLSNHTCDCTTGSSGTLCQVLPTGNGLCNEKFNERKYNFDGGDCCVNSCISSQNHVCGRDESGLIYVGYDSCKTGSYQNTGFRQSISSSFEIFDATYISLSENGRVLALIDSLTSSLLVFDNDASIWTQRGSPVTNLAQPRNSLVRISTYDSSMKNKNIYPPVTLALKTTSGVVIYIWDKSIWKEKGSWTFNETTVVDVHLQEQGNSLGVLLKNGSFRSFRRSHYASLWVERNLFDGNSYSFFSLPQYVSSHFVLANQSCIELHSFEGLINRRCEDKQIRAINISPKGKFVAMLVDYEGTTGNMYIYDVRKGQLDMINGFVRGVSIVNPNIDIHDDGVTVTTHSTFDNKIWFHNWFHNSWHAYSLESGNMISFSADKSLLAFVSSKLESTSGAEGLVSLYHFDSSCEEGMSRMYFTFIPDINPLELSWEILNITSRNEVHVLMRSDQHINAGGMIVKDLCVNNYVIASDNSTDVCIVIKIIDLGLDGLRSPGKVGISVNGTIKWSIDSTDGYENFLPVFGNTDICMLHFNTNDGWSPKYNDKSLHHDCSLNKCSWTKVGSENINSTITESLYFRSDFDLSADGTVFALTPLNFSPHEGIGQVRVLEHKRDGGWVQLGSNITSLNLDDVWFGYSVSISADGSVVAVSAPKAIIDDKNYGKVIVYSYDKNNSSWDKRGDEIHGTLAWTYFGSYISLSADGTIVAAGTRELYRFCQIYVFKYDESINQWNLRGKCLDGTEEGGTAVLELSSNGLMIAIGYMNRQKDRGEVKVYEFDFFSNDWIQRGNLLTGESTGHTFGKKISLSSDASVLAVAGAINFPIKVYSFNPITVEWEQRGHGINFNEGNDVNVALTSNGSVLVATYNYVVKFFIYDEFMKVWREGLKQVPSKSYSGSLDVSSQIALSADALTVATKADGVIDIYRFNVEDYHHPNCMQNSSLFNFTIQPDQFPEDIVWSLRNGDDELILGGDEINALDGNRFVYNRCLQNNNTYFTFLIEDTYGDGVCCDWGHGDFTLEWNNQKVLDSEGFQNHKSACLSQNFHISVFHLEIESSSAVASWALFDSEFSEKLREGHYMPNSRVGNSFYTCLLLPECANFAIYFSSGNGRAFSLTYNNSIIFDQKDEEFSFRKIPIGTCNVPSCPHGQTLLEIDIGTGSSPQGFSWVLEYSNSTILDRSESFVTSYKFYHYQKCVIVDCLSLVLVDRTGKGGQKYVVSKNGSSFVENKTSGFLERVAIGTCQKLFCSKDENTLEVEFVFLSSLRRAISWELTDSDNANLASREKYDYGQQQNYFHHHNCNPIQINECMTFRLFDAVGQGDVYYSLTLNGDFVKKSLTIKSDFLTEVTIGSECRDIFTPCSQGQTHFRFDLFAGTTPDSLSWEVIDSNNSSLAQGGNYSGGLRSYSFQDCLNIEKECATLHIYDTNIGKSDRANGTSSFYSVMWDDHNVGGRFLERHSPHSILLCDWNKECEQNESFLGLIVNTDAFPEDLSWRLVDSNDTILYEENSFEEKLYESFEYNYCLVVPNNDCLTFQLTDTYSDGGTHYSITWNQFFWGRKQIFGNVKEHVSICNWNTTCPQNDTFFALIINTDKYPGEFSWKILNSNEILEHRNYLNSDMFTRDTYSTCLSTSVKCLVLELDDEDGGASYSITWGDRFVQGTHQRKTTESVTIGDCG